MKKISCYNTTKEDEIIAKKLGYNPNSKHNEYFPYRIATLRGMYDDEHPTNPIDLDNIDDAYNRLSKYAQTLSDRRHAEVKSASSHIAESYQKLKREFTSQEMFDRVTMISTLVSALLDNLQRENPQFSRKQLLEGVEVKGRKCAGQMAILDAVYYKLMSMYEQYMNYPHGTGVERAKKIRRVLDNWGALSTYVRIRLRDTEGIKLNDKEEFVAEANLDNYGFNQLSELLDMSESKREAWQEVNEQKDAFGTIGQQVRRAISSLPKIIKNELTGQPTEEYDDLGFKRMLDPVKIHQQLLDILRGIQNSEDMMNTLKENLNKHPWLSPIIQALQTNPQLKTQFFVDFKKNFQLLSEIRINKKGGFATIKTMVLNKIRDIVSTSYFNNITRNASKMSSDITVFDEDGNVNWKNLKSLRDEIIDVLDVPLDNKDNKNNSVFDRTKKYVTKENQTEENKRNTKRSKFWSSGTMSRDDRKQFLLGISERLGLDVDMDLIEYVLDNPKLLSTYTNALLDFVKYGIDNIPVVKENIDSKTPNNKVLFKSLIKNSGRLIKTAEKIEKLNTIISNFRGGKEVSSRVVRKDAKGKTVSLSSNINPCYMGDKFELIQRYIQKDDKVGLKKFLEKNFLCSSYFMYEGKILNKWLEDLYNACNNPIIPLNEDIVGKLFDYQRMLGSPDFNFEDFTTKQHALDMLYEFISDEEQGRTGNTALYPIFILGDSGICKYVRQRRYSTDEIIDGLYNVYRQEVQRMKQVRAANKKLEDLGEKETGTAYTEIVNFSDSDGKFSFLPFLNDDEYRVPDDATEAQVKESIRRYLNDSYKTFKTKLDEAGVLETVGNKQNQQSTEKSNPKYTYLDQFLKGKDLDERLQDFFFNTKFATIQQMQLMTIDPSFYENTKDLQKRYKEIHAPGTIIDPLAINPYTGERYCKNKDGMERCIYFDDIGVNIEEVDEDFMRLMQSKNPDQYSAYKKAVTLTDGQGYRSISSYRSVMGMAGQWTKEMEDLYNKIMDLREKYGRGKIPAEELKIIEDMAVIFKPLKPYMFTHEHFPLNNNEDLLIPVQHKYAEAVLIPELLPDGSKLKDIAYYMEDHDIDMIGSTKICKVGYFGTTKIDHLDQYDEEIKSKMGKDYVPTNKERIDLALSKAYVHKLSYYDYRIQTNVPDHVYQPRLFATQIRKLIMSGIIKYDGNGKLINPIDKDGHYQYEHYVDYQEINLGGKIGKVRLTGRNLLAFYNALIVANMLESFETFKESIADEKNVSDRLIQNIISNGREALDCVLAYAITGDEKLAMPLFEGGLEHDAAALLLSIYKKLVNKQVINGGAGVQVSAMGIQDYSEDGGLKIIYDYEKDDNGEYKLDGNGKKIPTNILYAECEIPFNFSYTVKETITDENGNKKTVRREVNLEYNDYVNEDGSLIIDSDGTPRIEKVFPGILDIVAYRIPTERAYSMINLKVKRFSKKTEGGTIKVPLHYTKIAGFDFDIDKLYFMRKEFVAKENSEPTNKLVSDMFNLPLYDWETYNEDRPPLQQSKAARNNMLLHLIQCRLTDPETLVARTTPGGFTNPSQSARILREFAYGDISDIKDGNGINWDLLYNRAKDKKSDPEPNYDPSDPITILTYNQMNQIASKLIGIFANHNTNHAFASFMRTFKINKDKAIEFAGHTVEEGYGFDLLHAPKGVDVELHLAEFLAASVDAVKDPVLNYLNFNTLTADSAALLTRVGYNTLEIGLLFNQPIIREVCEYAFNNGLSLEVAIRDIMNQYCDQFNVDKNKIAISKNNTSLGALADNLINFRNNNNILNDQSFALKQIQILQLFKNISDVASEVSQFVTSTKFTAANAVSSNFGDMYAQQMKVENYVRSLESKESSSIEIELTDFPVSDALPIKIDTDRLSLNQTQYSEKEIYNPFAYEQTMFDLNRKALIALSKYFPYETKLYKDVRNIMMHLTKGKYLDGNTVNDIHRDLLVYLLANQEASIFNGEILRDTKYGQISTRDYFINHFYDDLLDFLNENPDLKKSPLFSHMIPDYDKATDTYYMSIINVGGLESYQKDEIQDSWDTLYKEHPEIATDLFLYNFFRFGFDFKRQSFMDLAPTSLKESLIVPSSENENRSYVDFLNEILDGKLSIYISDFIKQFIINHPDNKKLIYDVKSKTADKIIRPLAMKAGEPKSSFILDLSSLKSSDRNNAKSMFVLAESKNGNMWFVPAIKIEGELFIANTEGTDFNMSNNGCIEYVHIPSVQFKTYTSAENSTHYYTGPIEDEKIEGNTSQAPEDVPDGNLSQTEKNDIIDSIANDLAEAYAKNGFTKESDGSAISAEYLKRYFLSGLSDQELKDTIETLKKACRENGVLMLDENGELKQGC